MKPVKKPSNIIAKIIYFIFGQYLSIFLSQTKKVSFYFSLASQTITLISSKGSSINLQRIYDSTPITVRMMKQILFPNRPKAKVVSTPPKMIWAKTIPFMTPIYLPSADVLMPFILKSLTMQPPWLTHSTDAPYPPITAPTIEMINLESQLKSTRQSAQLMVQQMAAIQNCLLKLVSEAAQVSPSRQITQLRMRERVPVKGYYMESFSKMNEMMLEKLVQVVTRSRKKNPRTIVCLRVDFQRAIRKSARNQITIINDRILTNQTFNPNFVTTCVLFGTLQVSYISTIKLTEKFFALFLTDYKIRSIACGHEP